MHFRQDVKEAVTNMGKLEKTPSCHLWFMWEINFSMWKNIQEKILWDPALESLLV